MSAAFFHKADYPLLRLTQTAVGEKQYAVNIVLEIPGQRQQAATSVFTFALTVQDQEDIRWYLEDYLQYPQDPAPVFAARAEQRIAEIGRHLFNGVFQSRDAFKLWSRFQAQLAEARVEIATTVRDAAAIPWELLRDPDTDTPLALRARAFVRTHTHPGQPTLLPKAATKPVPILLVICRPGAGHDVPFRSVASRIVKSLSEDARAVFQLDVLRPPTFGQLAHTLRQAKVNGRPYQAVHFDGHGLYLDDGEATEFSSLLLSGFRAGSHGYLAFENSAVEENMQLVDGTALGQLLVETNVPLLVLNACRSAHAEATPAPEQTGVTDVHTEVRAYGTLAQEVMDQGVTGVAAMRYNVYVVTAAQFVANLYAALASGQSLGEAVSLGRKQLAAQPSREIIYDSSPLQDWIVPVVYEATPLRLFPLPEGKGLTIALRAADAAPERGEEIDLPAPPDAGFWGRDETLLTLDRVFDTQQIALLHACAGSGKTATVAEFARWYALTGGSDGPVLFTSFERYLPLPRVLDLIGRVFGPALERSGTHWLTLADVQRREVTLQILNQVPVFWIWDNIEPIAGFPTGSSSAWKRGEQSELLDFLRAVRGTKAKLLLTSRREERSWLGDLPARITLPAMFMQERVELARALALKRGKTLTAVHDWRPLLEFTGGNPHALTVVFGHAFREGLKTPQQIELFVERLRAGEVAFPDEASEGRSKSLGASLKYGFENAFNEAEHRQLALLHLFQGFVDADTLRMMGEPKASWCVPELSGVTPEQCNSLLDRAAEVGLLTRHVERLYSIHPAVPWFLKKLFVTSFPDPSRASLAFVESMGELGDHYHRLFSTGFHEAFFALTAEEENLLHALRLARTTGCANAVIGIMQGLVALYDHTGRHSEYARLVAEIVPEFVDPVTDGPLQGRENGWRLITDYRAHLARITRDWRTAERLRKMRVEYSRKLAAPILETGLEKLDSQQVFLIRSLAASLHELAQLQCEMRRRECIDNFKESLRLAGKANDRTGVAICALNYGHAFIDIPELRDLDKAERLYQKALHSYEDRDSYGRAQCLGQLGLVAYERFREAKSTNKPQAEQLKFLRSAASFNQQALELLPPTSPSDLAVVYNQLGVIREAAGELNAAMTHWRESIRNFELAGATFNAAGIRFNVALALERAGRLPDALVYAEAALRGYQSFTLGAVKEIETTQQLIAQIQTTARNQS